MDGIFRLRSGANGPADVITGSLRSGVSGLSFADATDPTLVCRTPSGVEPEEEIHIAGTFLAKTADSCSFEFQFDGELAVLGDWPSYFMVTASRNGGPPGPVREDDTFQIRVIDEFA